MSISVVSWVAKFRQLFFRHPGRRAAPRIGSARVVKRVAAAGAFLASFGSLPTQQASAAHVVVIDFEKPDVPNSQTIAAPLSQDSFRLTTNDPLNGFSIIESDSLFYTGTQSMITPFTGSSFTIESVVPLVRFRPVSIDVSEFSDFGPSLIPVQGTTVGGNILTTAIVTDGLADFGSLDTIQFGITENLVSLTITNASPSFLFDNVVLEVSTVPEPSSCILVMFGLGLAGSRRRKEKQGDKGSS